MDEEQILSKDSGLQLAPIAELQFYARQVTFKASAGEIR
jgi:hypothetical protein